MISGYERRKCKRLPIELSIGVNDLFKQDSKIIEGIKKEIFVFDISKTGIGFICEVELPTGYYFNTKICLNKEEFFYAVILIVRVINKNNEFIHGAEFVGLAPFLANKINDYEESIRMLI